MTEEMLEKEIKRYADLHYDLDLSQEEVQYISEGIVERLELDISEYNMFELSSNIDSWTGTFEREEPVMTKKRLFYV